MAPPPKRAAHPALPVAQPASVGSATPIAAGSVQGALSLQDRTVLHSDVWDAQRASQKARIISCEPFGVVKR